MKRAIIMVLDSLGIGALPDAAEYTDAGPIPSATSRNMRRTFIRRT